MVFFSLTLSLRRLLVGGCSVAAVVLGKTLSGAVWRLPLDVCARAFVRGTIALGFGLRHMGVRSTAMWVSGKTTTVQMATGCGLPDAVYPQKTQRRLSNYRTACSKAVIH